MNNPEVTMHEQQQPTRFDALEKATTAAGIAIPLVIREPLAKSYKTTRCQAHRSGPSQAGAPALQGCSRFCSARVPAGDGPFASIPAAIENSARGSRVPAPLKPLADQVIHSASSVPANIAEGAGRTGRDRMHHWRIAYGSAKEVDIHLRLLVGTGALDPSQVESSLNLFDDVRAMTCRPLHPNP